jgi:penicillin-binding protein 2
MSPPRGRRGIGPGGRRRPRDGRVGEGNVTPPIRPHVPRPLPPPHLEDDSAERPRTRITSSPLRRVEEEEKEHQRRNEPVHVGLRLTVMGIVVLGLFSMMLVRLWSLQVLQGPAAQRYEHSLSTTSIVLPAPRGLILSREGSVLVANRVMTVITLDRQVAANNATVVQRLAVALGISTATINSDLNDQQDSRYEPVPVAVGVPESVILYLSEHKAQFPGVTVSYVAERTYPDAENGASMLGYVADITSQQLKTLSKYGYLASDVIGQYGIEQQYESWLRGKPGKQVLEVDAIGDAVGTQSISPPTAGDDVVLNVDLGLENEVQTALANEIATLHHQGLPTNSGSAVVLDPQNGAVLAMASYPTYNPEWWVGGMSTAHYLQLTGSNSQQPLVNKAIQGLYVPGSTFKLATATAGLNEGLITPYTPYTDPGSFTLPNCSVGCTFLNNEGESCGSCDVTTALTVSDDVFFYTLGFNFWAHPSTYGDMPVQHAAQSYGFGLPTGVDLPGELAGQVDSPALRVWQVKHYPKDYCCTYYGPADALETAFGQGETVVTPLQLANAYATFANGGTRYAPQVAAGIVSPTGKVVKVFKPKVLGHVQMSSSTYNAIFQGLQGVVQSGTTGDVGTAYGSFVGYPYSLLPLAGKTGTATTSTNKNVPPTALFVGFGPATGAPTAPQYVVAVIIPLSGYGASDAAPVVRQIFEYLIKHPIKPVTFKAPANAG